MLSGKYIVLGVTGGIAAYKSCELVSRLKKLGADVEVIMTENAARFVAPLTFETLSGKRVITDTFDRNFEYNVKHVSISKKASLFVVAPATANLIAKYRSGIADDMLTTTLLAVKCPVLICPAMNTAMYEHEATRENIKTLSDRGVHFLEPECGYLACGDNGKGRMAEPLDIVNKIEEILAAKKDLTGKTILVTAGATRENIDGVRFISNRSSGKMGIRIAENARDRGADVVLIAGSVSVPIPYGMKKVVRVSTTLEMYEAAVKEFIDCDAAIMAAAPADYRLKQELKEKQKSPSLTLELVKNPDIAAKLGEIKENRKLIVFSAETNDLINNASEKLKRKNADLAVANDVTLEGAGFDIDTNIASFVYPDGRVVPLEKMAKEALAAKILDEFLNL